MADYIDGFAFPIKLEHLEEYQEVAVSVAKIWKEHGALAYYEFVGDDLKLEGTRSFPDALGAKDDETIVFGWVTFKSKESRDLAGKKVAEDPRMPELVGSLVDPSRVVFDASRMAYGGFKPLV